MKAARFHRFGSPEVLEIVALPDPHAGPGQVRIAVRAAGVNPSDWKKRQGLMDEELPQTMGHEAAGVIDELGGGVTDVSVGDRVFGFDAEGAAQAELAVLSSYAPIPPSLDFATAAALPAAIETATRALDQLGARSGTSLLVAPRHVDRFGDRSLPALLCQLRGHPDTVRRRRHRRGPHIPHRLPDTTLPNDPLTEGIQHERSPRSPTFWPSNIPPPHGGRHPLTTDRGPHSHPATDNGHTLPIAFRPPRG